jgi:hypothetical protein
VSQGFEGDDSTPLDPVVIATLEAANAEHGTSFRLLRRLPGGHQTGAYALLSEDGQRAVLKRWVGPRPFNQLQEAAATVGAARSAGWPTPAWLHWGTTPDGVAYEIQEFVDGDHRHELDDRTLDALLAVNARQADLDPPTSNDWSAWALGVVYRGSDGLLEEVTRFPDGGSRLASAVDRVRRLAGLSELPDRDLVCGVFSLENVLFGPDGVRAVIDVQALGRGTRAFDLAVLYSRLSSAERRSAIGRRLRVTAEDIAGPGAFAVCLAAELVGVLHFVIRNNPAVGEAAFTAAADALESLAPEGRGRSHGGQHG